MKDEASFAEHASGSQQHENVIRNQSSLSTEQIDTITRKVNGSIVYYTDSSQSQPAEQMRPSLMEAKKSLREIIDEAEASKAGRQNAAISEEEKGAAAADS